MASITGIKVYTRETIDWFRARYPNLATFALDKGGGYLIGAGAGYTLHEIRDHLQKNNIKHEVQTQ
jgi:hypothetical protein